MITADFTHESALVSVVPERGGFLHMEIVWEDVRWQYPSGKRYLVRLVDSRSYFSRHSSFSAAVKACLRRAYQFDDGGELSQSGKSLLRKKLMENQK